MPLPSSLILIPARYASTRYPGKPLELLGGKPIIQRVVEQASRVSARVVVATDDERIAQCVRSFGGEVVMTAQTHRSGTDRIIEAYERIGQGEQVVVNLQGDEPFVEPEQIQTLISAFQAPNYAEIATLAEPFAPETSNEELCNPNIVKLVRGAGGQAHYFSRLPIPYLRGQVEAWCRHHQYYRHVGLYAFRADLLPELKCLEPSHLELAESLEQLRWIEAGYRITVLETRHATIGIDTPEDMARAEAFLRSL